MVVSAGSVSVRAAVYAVAHVYSFVRLEIKCVCILCQCSCVSVRVGVKVLLGRDCTRSAHTDARRRHVEKAGGTQNVEDFTGRRNVEREMGFGRIGEI